MCTMVPFETKTHSESDGAQQQHHGIDETPAVDLHLESEAHRPQSWSCLASLFQKPSPLQNIHSSLWETQGFLR